LYSCKKAIQYDALIQYVVVVAVAVAVAAAAVGVGVVVVVYYIIFITLYHSPQCNMM